MFNINHNKQGIQLVQFKNHDTTIHGWHNLDVFPMLNYNAFTMIFPLRYLSSCLNILCLFVNVSCILIILLVVFLIDYGKSYFQIAWTLICVNEWQAIWTFFRFGYNLMTLWKRIRMFNWTSSMCIWLYFECFQAWFYLLAHL
jgi:hypothetical protein